MGFAGYGTGYGIWDMDTNMDKRDWDGMARTWHGLDSETDTSLTTRLAARRKASRAFIDFLLAVFVFVLSCLVSSVFHRETRYVVPERSPAWSDNAMASYSHARNQSGLPRTTPVTGPAVPTACLLACVQRVMYAAACMFVKRGRCFATGACLRLRASQSDRPRAGRVGFNLRARLTRGRGDA